MFDSKKLARVLFRLHKSEQADTLVENFFQFLKKKKLLVLLPQIYKHVQRLERESKKEHTLFITSPYQLSSEDIEEIQKLVGVQDAPVEVKEDKTLIGGFSASYGERIYHGSLKNQLAQFEAHLKKPTA